MKTLAEILAEVQALSTVTEDQFETTLAGVVTDLQALVDATPASPVAPTVVSATVTVNFSDGTSQPVPAANE
jgi:hypothetical protein